MKTALIGTGLIVRTFLEASKDLPGYELTVLCGREHRKEEMLAMAEKYGIKSISFSYDDVLAGESEVIYIGLVNNLHYEYAKKALLAGKHVIMEKPFTVTAKQCKELIEIAKEKKVFLFEAINNQYLPNYIKAKELLPKVGEVKIVSFNYSQYSSRYDRFKAGETFPVFSKECCGGALLDLNCYNVWLAVGMFGRPEKVSYCPNIERGVDTSGILTMSYPDFQCVCVGSKDCTAPLMNQIQGNKAYILMDSAPNEINRVILKENKKDAEEYQLNRYEHRMVEEFLAFEQMIKDKNYGKCEEMLELSLMVCEILDEARLGAGIIFDCDEV